jgi:DNA-binding NarL/FixJ family response regulator/HPt (histidine-containing phosphotransfer) domain-containing protein
MDETVIRVLVVEDNPGDARLVEWALTHEPEGTFRSERAARVSNALEQLDRGPVDVVLLDLGLPDSHEMDGLERVRAKDPRAAVVVLTGSEDPQLMRRAIVGGAQDYVVKGIFPPGHLGRVLHAAIRRQRVESQLFHDQVPVARLLATSGERDEGIAVLSSGGETSLNEAFGRLTGVRPGRSSEMPAWLAGIFGGRGPTLPGMGAAVSNAPPGSLDAGQFALSLLDGRRVELEYVVRRPTADGSAPAMVWLRELARNRPAPLRDEGETVPPPKSAPAKPTRRSRSKRPPEQLIDPSSWAQLQELAGKDPTFLPALIDTFLEEGPRLVRRLEVAASRGDAVSIAQTAHSLKSSCAQVGALGLSRDCAELERLGRAGDLEGMRAGVLRIVQQFPPLADALSALRSKS